jgi:hypothetical protein
MALLFMESGLWEDARLALRILPLLAADSRLLLAAVMLAFTRSIPQTKP